MGDRLWAAVSQIALGVMLGEVAPRVALGEVLGTIEQSLGIACAVEDLTGLTVASSPLCDSIAEHTPRTNVSFELRDADERPAGRLVMFGGVDSTVGERLARVLDHLAAFEPPGRESAAGRASAPTHALRNKVAVALANIELVESMLGGSSPESPFLVSATSAERAILLQALTHAADATRALAASIAPVSSPHS
jgi:hypothetical protein